MDRDSRLAILIGLGVVAVVAAPVLVWWYRDSHRPRLFEARVVTATAADPVLREGQRHVGSDEAVKIAVALRVGRCGHGEQWLAPGPALVVDGVQVEPTAEQWPEQDRTVRVFWFTVESKLLGGDISAANANDRLAYRTYLASELGRDLVARGEPEAHNDDSLGRLPVARELSCGTMRFYARVEVVAAAEDSQAVQAVSSLGVEHLREAGFPAISRSARLPIGLHAAVGELFRLPGFEPRSDVSEAWDEVVRARFGLPFTELVEARLAVSSRTFAAVAVSGRAALADDRLEPLGPIAAERGTLSRGGRRLRWERDVRPGDLLRLGERWLVLLEDDGDSELSAHDLVMYSYRAPAAVVRLHTMIGVEPTTLEQLRLRGSG